MPGRRNRGGRGNVNAQQRRDDGPRGRDDHNADRSRSPQRTDQRNQRDVRNDRFRSQRNNETVERRNTQGPPRPPKNFGKNRNFAKKDELLTVSSADNETKGKAKTSLQPIESLFSSDFTNAMQLGHHRPNGIMDIHRVRTGGHIAFVRAAAIGLACCRNLASTVLLNSLASQACIQDRVDFVDNMEYDTTDFMRVLGDKELYLAPFTAQNLMQINRIDWEEQRMKILPLEKAQIRQMSIRVAAGCPTAAQIAAMEAGTFNDACTVYLGRFLTCVDAPAIIAAYLWQRSDPQPMTEAERDIIVNGVLRQMILGAACVDANITLDWENIAQSMPVTQSREEKNDLRDIMTMCLLPTTVQAIPYIPLHQEVVVDSVFLLVQINNKVKDKINLSKDGQFKALKYTDLATRINYQYLYYALDVAARQTDPFRSLENAMLVNKQQFLTRMYEARHGPMGLPEAMVSHAFNGLCDVTFRPNVLPFVTEYCVGIADRANVVSFTLGEVARKLFPAIA